MRVDRHDKVMATLMLVALLIGVWAGCTPPAQSGVFKMQIDHRGKPVCVFYLPSDQDSDTDVSVRTHPGPCPDTIIDQPISAEPRQ